MCDNYQIFPFNNPNGKDEKRWQKSVKYIGNHVICSIKNILEKKLLNLMYVNHINSK